MVHFNVTHARIRAEEAVRLYLNNSEGGAYGVKHQWKE